MISITAFYEHGIDSNKDKAAFAIADKFGAKFQGGGCCLFGSFERDLEWQVKVDELPKMVRALRASGFRVVTRNAA